MEWLPEFNKKRTAYGVIAKPQPPVAPTIPVPIIPSLNTCMSLTSGTTTTTTASSSSTSPTVSTTPSGSLVAPAAIVANQANHLQALAEVCSNVIGVDSFQQPPPGPVMNSLVSETKVIAEPVPLPSVVAAAAAAAMPGLVVPSTEPMDCNTTPISSPSHRSKTPAQEDEVMVENISTSSCASGSMQVEVEGQTSLTNGTQMIVEQDGDQLAESNDGHNETQTSEEINTDKQLTCEDLSLLCDLFYLPFEHGGQGIQLLQEFNWLKSNAHVLIYKSEVDEEARKADEAIQYFHSFEPDVPEILCRQHPSILSCGLLPTITDQSVSKRLITCVLAALRANGKFSIYNRVPLNLDSRLGGARRFSLDCIVFWRHNFLALVAGQTGLLPARRTIPAESGNSMIFDSALAKVSSSRGNGLLTGAFFSSSRSTTMSTSGLVLSGSAAEIDGFIFKYLLVFTTYFMTKVLPFISNSRSSTLSICATKFASTSQREWLSCKHRSRRASTRSNPNNIDWITAFDGLVQRQQQQQQTAAEMRIVTTVADRCSCSSRWPVRRTTTTRPRSNNNRKCAPRSSPLTMPTDLMKDYRDTSNLNINNLTASNEQLYLKQQQLYHQQQQQQNFRTKLDESTVMAAEAYKRLINQYPNLAEHHQQFASTNDLESNNGMPYVDPNLLKLLSPKSNKTCEKQVFPPIGYSRNLTAAVAAAQAAREAEQLQQLKYNYQSTNNCRQYLINNADALKVLQHQNSQMERLRGADMNQRVHKAMEQWLETIKYVQECRKQEIANATKRQKESLHCISLHDDSDIMALAESIYKLTKASRYARTAMFNAMQATILYDKEIESRIVETNQDIVEEIKLNESDKNNDSDFSGDSKGGVPTLEEIVGLENLTLRPKRTQLAEEASASPVISEDACCFAQTFVLLYYKCSYFDQQIDKITKKLLHLPTHNQSDPRDLDLMMMRVCAIRTTPKKLRINIEKEIHKRKKPKCKIIFISPQQCAQTLALGIYFCCICNKTVAYEAEDLIIFSYATVLLQMQQNIRKHVKTFNVNVARYRKTLYTIPEVERAKICGPRRFNPMGAMPNNLHTTVHGGHKDFACDRCEKEYGRKSNLLKHQKTVHEGRRDYACDNCEQKFGEKSMKPGAGHGRKYANASCMRVRERPQRSRLQHRDTRNYTRTRQILPN
ncbi:unnamed protein product [Trichogramma brassicae]|uniref:C2H2-type domain-containing protein n=1 Tax=Trichogramma brassicae TaxID=86971 RepID=A0A6H5IWX9_9HYME|nr:unnamed protein product [Trichogramma brassicae]